MTVREVMDTLSNDQLKCVKILFMCLIANAAEEGVVIIGENKDEIINYLDNRITDKCDNKSCETVESVLNTLTTEQRTAVEYIISCVIKDMSDNDNIFEILETNEKSVMENNIIYKFKEARGE